MQANIVDGQTSQTGVTSAFNLIVSMCLAIPGKILSTQGEDFARSARVSFGGIVREVSLAYVPEATIGDYVVVHVGFAISLLDEAEAMRTFEYLKQMGEVDELENLPGQ